MNKPSVLLILFLSFNSILFSQSTEFWGTTNGGGEFNIGAITRVNSEGQNIELLHSFGNMNNSGSPTLNSLTKASDGSLYGTTNGRFSPSNVLFKYSPIDSIYKQLADFKQIEAYSAIGSLVETEPGILFGISSSSTALNSGSVIYKYDISNDTLTAIYTFRDSLYTRNATAGLIQANNGKLYGLTAYGGDFNYGTLFEYSINEDSLRVLFHFRDSVVGIRPRGKLMQASDGLIYGVNATKIFKFDITMDTIVAVKDFTLRSSQTPFEGLVEAPNGKFYGKLESYGSFPSTLYEYDLLQDTIQTVWNFAFNDDHFGSELYVLDSNTLVGTKTGSFASKGFIYEFDLISKTLSPTVYFNNTLNGRLPYSLIISSADSKIIGLTGFGGVEDEGTLFELDSTYNLKKLYDFGTSPMGKYPNSDLVQLNGILFGTTREGGLYGNGTIYSYNPEQQQYQKRIDFEESITGSLPEGNMILHSNNLIYGICGSGTLFEYNPILDTVIARVKFEGFDKPSQPEPVLIKTNEGKLLGITSKGGGRSNKGVIYQYDPLLDSFSVRAPFEFGGQDPISSKRTLFQARNNKIYITDNFASSLFELDESKNSIIAKAQSPISDFTTEGDLIEYKNGKLLGIIRSDNGFLGIMYEYDYLTDSISIKTNLREYQGIYPTGNLIQSRNGRVFGGNVFGGINGYGTLFEYDIENDSIIVKLNFGPNGPAIDHLMEVDACYSTNSIIAIDSTLESTVEGATYQWYKCNSNIYTPITGTNSKAYHLTDTGRYAVEIKKGNCIDTSKCFTVYAIGIEKNEEFNHISINPNPFKESFTINNRNAQNLVLKLFDVSGKLIMESALLGKLKHTINYELPKGFYVAELELNGKFQRYKLVKE